MNANNIIYRQQARSLAEILKEQSIILIIAIILLAIVIYQLIRSYRAKKQLTGRCGVMYPVNASTTLQLMWQLNRVDISNPEIYMGAINRYSVQCINLKMDAVLEKSLWSVFVGLEVNASMEEYIRNYRIWKTKEFILYDLEKAFLKAVAGIEGVILLLSLLGSVLGSISIYAMEIFMPITCIFLLLQIILFKAKQQIIYKRIVSLEAAVLLAGIADENDFALIKREGKKRISL